MLLLDTSSLIMIHFGVNPVSGGRPPSDNNTVRVISVMRGDLLHRLDREVEVVFLL